MGETPFLSHSLEGTEGFQIGLGMETAAYSLNVW